MREWVGPCGTHEGSLRGLSPFIPIIESGYFKTFIIYNTILRRQSTLCESGVKTLEIIIFSL